MTSDTIVLDVMDGRLVTQAIIVCVEDGVGGCRVRTGKVGRGTKTGASAKV